MATIIGTGKLVTLDESDGLQNSTTTTTPAGDADDNDILLASLPSAFSSRLTVLSAGTAMEAALSGYTGAVGDTGSNAFTITGSVTDISFVDSDGNPLNGVDSGLYTLDGRTIFLYLDPEDNNILLGRVGLEGATDAPDDDLADEDGAIVFAAYIEETYTASTPPTLSGGKIWTVLYQPLLHPDTSNPDDARSLADKVFIGTSQDMEFSLANAPSGQNLFLMFTTANPGTETVNGVVRITDPTIIATGKNPADQSTGVNITTGDTINTSQAGGPTTFGTNNQMIVEQEGIRFTFVTGARQDVTIPNLDQNEADVEANIDFTAMFNTRGADFDVVQLQSGKSAQVKISAFSTAVEPGVNFIDGYDNDTAVAIDTVRVFSGTQEITTGISISIVGGIATITGVKAGYRIEYTTSTDHNRVLIENAAAVDAKGNNHADFDIGGFTLLKVNTEAIEIGSKMIFEDDGPSIDANAVAVPTLTTDDTDIPDTAGPTSFAGLFTSAFGEDGFKDSDDNDVQDADAITYALGVSAAGGVDSGLVDTLSGNKIYLFLQGGAVVGRVGTDGGAADPAGATAFTISVVANTGNVTLLQSRSIVHDNPLDPVESGASAAGLAAASLVTLTATITDGDGDTDAATRNIGDAFKFEDDGPSIDPNAVAVPTLTTDDTDIPDTAGPTSFAGLFTSAFGKDSFKDSDDNDAQDADAITYALGVSAAGGVDSGLVDTLSGNKIYLFLQGGAVVGRVGTDGGAADPAGATAFTISVVANTGNVSLAQTRSVVHNDPTDPAETGASAAGLAASLVTLTATITDGDGDTDAATRNIGDAFKFEDDGPSIDPNAVAVPTLTTDDTDIPDTAGPTSFAGLFTSAFGKDGFKDSDDNDVQDADAITYALGVSAAGGVDSGLRDSLSGNKIFLFLQGGAVVGRVGTAADLANAAGAVAFTIAVVANTGNVSLAQTRSVMHNDPTDPVESGASAAGLAAASLVTLTATITDGDGDTDAATRNIGDAFKFEDDGPSLAFGNLVGTGTDLAQYGFWMMDAGADGPDADDLQIALTGFQLGGVAQAAGSFSLTEEANNTWTGSLSGDFNNDGTVDDDPLAFTLTALSDGTYALDLATPVQSTTTIDTADGGLGAGGPDPVQTLFIPEPPATPTETVVFFSAKIDASAASIAAGIIQGATDPTEAQLQGPPLASFVDPRSMNVSTAGIGVDNNNMNGHGASGNLAVIDDPDGPDNTDGGQNTPSDDSFVVNPGTLVDKVRVFIDNSVTGYDYTGGERLQYRVFYENGTWSDYTTVVGDLGKGTLPQFFEIDGAGQKIDAVQLTMLYGEIKIPNIQFVTVTESLAKDISLDFTASLTDADGDTVSSNFSADLFANEAAGATYDYELIGSLLLEEAFDVDLASIRNDYKITGFNVDTSLRDTLVLIGDPSLDENDIQIVYDDNIGQSIVTVDESGGQITTITVVGVELLASDIVIA